MCESDGLGDLDRTTPRLPRGCSLLGKHGITQSLSFRIVLALVYTIVPAPYCSQDHS
jgi:hypothetical protein